MTELIVRNKADVQTALQLLRSQLYVSYDIETTGLKVRHDKIIGFGVASENFAFYVITHRWANGELEQMLSKEDVLPIITALQKKRLYTWNGSFDTRFSYHYYGLNLWDSIYSDGMLAAHTLNENRFEYKLKSIAVEEFGASAASEQQDMLDSIAANGGSEKEFYKADGEIMAKYGLQDAKLTYRLCRKFDIQLKREGLADFFYKLEVMPLYTQVTIPMELRGVPVDMSLIEQTKTEITADLDALEDKIQQQIAPLLYEYNQWYIDRKFPFKLTPAFKNKLAEHFIYPHWPRSKTHTFSFAKADIERAQKKGLIPVNSELERYALALERPPEALIQKIQLQLLAESGVKYTFNILSKDNLKRLFFTKLNEVPLSRTDKGAAQVDDEFLDSIADKYEWVRDLRTYNKLTKIRGTYVEGVLAKVDNGIFYPSFFQHRTVSGRYGSDLQQLPRPIADGDAEPVVCKYNNRIRRFFIAGPGHKIVDADFESLEPHVFAHVSGEEKIKNIFRLGHDFYSTIAIDTEGLVGFSPDKKADNYLGKLDKKKRQDAKPYSLGIPYGMQGFLLGHTLGVSTQKGEELVAKYLRAYPDLKSWMDESKEFVIKHGYMRVESGRIRRFPELPGLIEKYGRCLLNPLEIWEKYGDLPRADYERMKALGRKARNCVNNAMNVQIQALASSIVNRGCIALARGLKAENLDAYICAQIHDEGVVRSIDAHATRAGELMQLAFENTYNISIPLKAAPSMGDNFADAKG